MNDSNYPPYVIAIARGLITAFILAGGAFFAALSVIDTSIADAGKMAGSAFFSALALRAGVEGLVDTRRKPG